MKIAPQIHPLEVPLFPNPEIAVLRNGIHLYGFNGAMNDVIRMELLFDGGRWLEEKPQTAEACARLFKSGNTYKNAFQIESAIDSLGATIKANAGYHGFTIALYVMRKHLPAAIDLLLECLIEAHFPESELHIYKRNALAKLELHQEKTDFLAEMEFKEQLFGAKHPYGYKTDAKDIEALGREDLIHFFRQQTQSMLPDIFLSGLYGEAELQVIADKFSVLQPGNRIENSEKSIVSGTEHQLKLKKEGATQATIILGKRLINKQHEDYPAFILLNTLFGGYFGSRLMTNIREEKGYTYGIYSSLQTYRHDAAFYIQTDTDNGYVDACRKEIEKECDRIRKFPVEKEELSQARNYLLGKFLTRMDGPFAKMETYKNYRIEGLDAEVFNNYAEIIKSTNTTTLHKLAQQYLDFNSFTEVIVGA